jgi:hypothetical protein
LLTKNEFAVTLPGRIASLNVAETLVPTATPVAVLSGLVGGTTVGGVVSGAPGEVTVRLTGRVVFPVPLVVFVKVTVSL